VTIVVESAHHYWRTISWMVFVIVLAIILGVLL
jgi:hypothetical protein